MPAQATPALADAFLALADDGEPPTQRSPARALVAAIAAGVLACAAPLAWTAPARGKPAVPTVALTSKLTAADDE